MMAFRRLSWLRRLVFVLACLQVLAPALAAVADSVGRDARTPYAHVESETGGGCVVVHPHDCALCSIATIPMARPVRGGLVVAPVAHKSISVTEFHVSPRTLYRACNSSRAPPVLLS